MDRRTWLAAASLSAASLAVAGQPAEPVRPRDGQQPKAPRAPKLAAIKLHAEWCPLCKTMGTLFEDLGRKFDAEPILFVKLDLTDQRGKLQAEYLCSVAGMTKLWTETGEGTKTGTILIVDAATKKIVEAIAHDTTWSQAEKIVTDALK
ncbi:MAG: hypothetical protein GIKADHBN_02173 [Phycisphaerales bacterium]|nr:hypothetical protein [Phycisphaerales bacterium]MCK6477592.1 thioredoxin domain-containing protein [Phycisphaerales bacterium]